MSKHHERSSRLSHSPREGIMIDAIHWLDVVGMYEYERQSQKDSPADRDPLRSLAKKIHENDYQTASILASLERIAKQATSTSGSKSHEEMQDRARIGQFGQLASLMDAYAEEALKHPASE